MAEYIEREALMKNFCGYDLTKCVKYGNESAEQQHDSYSTMMMYEIADEIEDAPTADVVSVIRCKECKHWKPAGSKAGNSFSDMEYIGGCEFTKYYRRESDFCSYGERKEGADRLEETNG